MADNLQTIRENITEDLIPDKKQRGKYLCPLCGSGSGGSGSDGAFSIDKDRVHGKCFSCGFYGDRFDLEAARTGLSLQEATRAVLARCGVSGFDPAPAPAQASAPAASPADRFPEILRRCAGQLPGSEGEAYLSSRGIKPETMRRFMLGYDPGKRAVTIPYNKACSYYSTRAIDPAAAVKHWKPADVPSALFNAAALRQSEPVFVVESPLCAISVAQEGGSAVALSGAANFGIFLKELEAVKNPPVLILSLDNDPENEQGHRPGLEAEEKLSERLTAAGYDHIRFNVAGCWKDPNEALQEEPAVLRALISKGLKLADEHLREKQEQEASAYLSTSTAGSFDGFIEYLRRNADRKPVPTGFGSLDKILNGGLVPGLYIMGAVSSLGKTALMVNFADNIAAAGTDVLYFSLEMSKYELMARSISRLTFKLAGERKITPDEALSTFGVLFGAKQLTGPGSLLQDAMTQYRETIGQHIWYSEGVGSIGVDDVRRAVENHIAKTGRKPVVFIDYLQIMAAPDPRATDKHNTDVIVTSLKQLSRDEDIPVFCISSLNRMNYNEPVNMAAFKESGAIEYGSDVLIGLQLYGIGYKAGESKTAHEARIRELVEKAEKEDCISIQVRVLKNRNGKRGNSGELRFTKRFNTFYEMPEDFIVVYSDENPFTDDDDEPKRSKLPVL